MQQKLRTLFLSFVYISDFLPVDKLLTNERIKASYKLFDMLKCCTEGLNENFSNKALDLVEEDKMRCHIMNCLAALHVVQKVRDINQKVDSEKEDTLKRKVFGAACSLMIDIEFDNVEEVVSIVLSSFPDVSNTSDIHSWLPMHFSIALFIGNKISAEDVHKMHIADPLAMHRLSDKFFCNVDGVLMGCTPAHLLCMQKDPNVSMVRYFCLRDPKAFLLCDESGRCALHLVARYSESLELLQAMLQIDQAMTKKIFNDSWEEYTPLGLLCRRLQFPTFHKMVACLIEVDSSVEVIYSSFIGCLRSCRFIESEDQSLQPGSQGEKTEILLGILLNANLDVIKYDNSHIFRESCRSLIGQLGVAVLSSLLIKFCTGIKSISFDRGILPIHEAASYSSLCVLKFLHTAYPESLSLMTNTRNNLLHLAFVDLSRSDAVEMKDKVQYLCEQCPAFIHHKNDEGNTPLHDHFLSNISVDIKSVIYLCNIDPTVVRDKCTPSEQLPLHLLILRDTPRSELSDSGDCFRLFLRLYPASAGIKDLNLMSPYHAAVSRNLSPYFMRLLLSADPTIDPVKRHNLNFAARRDAMFLAFRALSGNLEPTIWAKIRYEDKNLLARVISYL